MLSLEADPSSRRFVSWSTARSGPAFASGATTSKVPAYTSCPEVRLSNHAAYTFPPASTAIVEVSCRLNGIASSFTRRFAPHVSPSVDEAL